ncbi:MAG: 3-isopropylmalate dehydrogenase [Helicobacteraceae bacterium]|jgi:3-isopropylmalate dehydrogenase|nr:3-isopropylmalate dehydrogenase [Helicobacteraceae bacterium]
MKQLERKNGAKTYGIAVISGDGIGPEIIREARKSLNAAATKEGFSLKYDEYLMGGAAIDAVGEPLPKATLEGAKNADAVLFGAIGGEKWDNLPRDLRPETGLLALRKGLDAFANLRPVRVFDVLIDASPLKDDVIRGVDLLVVRELVGGIYFGQPRGRDDKRGWNTMVYSEMEIERIAKVAFEAAMRRGKKLCSVDKANVLEVSQVWREVVTRVAKDYPQVELSHMYVDNAAMQLVRNPRQFDVILTGNLFGDILSDEASMISGSIGLLPSSSQGAKGGIFEPIHGSAPDIAGKGIANPIAAILSAAMLCEFAIGEKGAAKRIEKAVKEALKLGYRTPDIAAFGAHGKVNTAEMGDIIADLIAKG